MRPEVEFINLPFIMFDSTLVSMLRNNSEPSKWYRAPHAWNKKREGEMGIFKFGTKLKKDRKHGGCLKWGSITYGKDSCKWLTWRFMEVHW